MWRSFSGVRSVKADPRGTPSTTSKIGCIIRERGRPWESTVFTVQQTMPAVAGRAEGSGAGGAQPRCAIWCLSLWALVDLGRRGVDALVGWRATRPASSSRGAAPARGPAWKGRQAHGVGGAASAAQPATKIMSGTQVDHDRLPSLTGEMVISLPRPRPGISAWSVGRPQAAGGRSTSSTCGPSPDQQIRGRRLTGSCGPPDSSPTAPGSAATTTPAQQPPRCHGRSTASGTPTGCPPRSRHLRPARRVTGRQTRRPRASTTTLDRPSTAPPTPVRTNLPDQSAPEPSPK